MNTTTYSSDKGKVLADIESNIYDGSIHFLFRIDKGRRQVVADELQRYGQVLYNEFSWARYLALIIDHHKAPELVDRLYSEGIEGILDVEVDSRSVSFDKS